MRKIILPALLSVLLGGCAQQLGNGVAKQELPLLSASEVIASATIMTGE